MAMARALRGAAVLFMCLAGSVAEAREPGVAPLFPPGLTLGVAVAVLPPPGLYYTSRSAYYNAELIEGDGRYGGRHANALSEGAQLIFVPGWEVLGAKVRLSMTQTLLYLQQDRSAPVPVAQRGSSNLLGLGNLKIQPIDLAWTLGGGFFVSAAFGVYAPTGYWAFNSPVNTGANFWTLEPSVAFSYFKDGWNATLHAVYNVNGENPRNHYDSGDLLFLNGTLTKNIAGFDIGPVGYYMKQVTDDANYGGRTTFGGIVLPPGEQLAVGLSIIRRVGHANLQVMYTQDIYARSGYEGSKIWLNLSFKLF
jgi:hypothetical protein